MGELCPERGSDTGLLNYSLEIVLSAYDVLIHWDHVILEKIDMYMSYCGPE
jgi:hypothetical protein